MATTEERALEKRKIQALESIAQSLELLRPAKHAVSVQPAGGSQRVPEGATRLDEQGWSAVEPMGPNDL